MSGDVLAAENAAVLEGFAAANGLVAFDYDGTLAAIVERPEDAWMAASTRQLLAEVTRSYPAIVISGRGQADLLRRLAGIDLFAAVGNHGLEPWHVNPDDERRVAGWTEQLRGDLGYLPGVWIEDKVFSLAVHYRQAPDAAQAQREILHAATRLGGVRILGGKRVVNLLPAAAPDKGAALEMARTWLACDTALYVGDDDTDEDVFRRGDPEKLLSIRVGPCASSHARYWLREQGMIDELLRRLAGMRADRRMRMPPLARGSSGGEERA